MALNPSTNASMVGRVTASDANYPYGSSKDETGPGNNDGTPYFLGRANDVFGFQQWLLDQAAIVPSGNPDTVLASDYGDALNALFSDVSLSNLSATGNDKIASAWVSFTGTGVIAIRDSLNVSGLTDFGVGDYSITFAATMANANYSFVTSLKADNDSVEGKLLFNSFSDQYDTSGLRLQAAFTNSASSGAIDLPVANVVFFGGL